jgi:hypothetical protein
LGRNANDALQYGAILQPGGHRFECGAPSSFFRIRSAISPDPCTVSLHSIAIRPPVTGKNESDGISFRSWSEIAVALREKICAREFSGTFVWLCQRNCKDGTSSFHVRMQSVQQIMFMIFTADEKVVNHSRLWQSSRKGQIVVAQGLRKKAMTLTLTETCTTDIYSKQQPYGFTANEQLITGFNSPLKSSKKRSSDGNA